MTPGHHVKSEEAKLSPSGRVTGLELEQGRARSLRGRLIPWVRESLSRDTQPTMRKSEARSLADAPPPFTVCVGQQRLARALLPARPTQAFRACVHLRLPGIGFAGGQSDAAILQAPPMSPSNAFASTNRTSGVLRTAPPSVSWFLENARLREGQPHGSFLSVRLW
jgi:hypothetical protein